MRSSNIPWFCCSVLLVWSSKKLPPTTESVTYLHMETEWKGRWFLSLLLGSSPQRWDNFRCLLGVKVVDRCTPYPRNPPPRLCEGSRNHSGRLWLEGVRAEKGLLAFKALKEDSAWTHKMTNFFLFIPCFLQGGAQIIVLKYYVLKLVCTCNPITWEVEPLNPVMHLPLSGSRRLWCATFLCHCTTNLNVQTSISRERNTRNVLWGKSLAVLDST